MFEEILTEKIYCWLKSEFGLFASLNPSKNLLHTNGGKCVNFVVFFKEIPKIPTFIWQIVKTKKLFQF